MFSREAEHEGGQERRSSPDAEDSLMQTTDSQRAHEFYQSPFQADSWQAAFSGYIDIFRRPLPSTVNPKSKLTLAGGRKVGSQLLRGMPTSSGDCAECGEPNMEIYMLLMCDSDDVNNMALLTETAQKREDTFQT